MDAILAAMSSELDVLIRLSPRIVAGLILMLVVMLVGRVAGAGLGRILSRTERTTRYARPASRLVRWLLGLLGLVLAMHVWGLTALATSLLATGGLMAVVLGFAFRDIGENLLAGVLLAFSRSFDVDDLIESGGLRGRVQAIELRHVHVRTGDGCDIFIPSAAIFRNPLHNFTRDGLRRGRFAIGIDYGDDAADAIAVLEDTVRTAPGVLPMPATMVALSTFAPTYVELEVLFWVDTFANEGLETVRTEAMTRCRSALRAAGFTFSSDVTTAVVMAPVHVVSSGRDV